jgi:hypothetical protein
MANEIIRFFYIFKNVWSIVMLWLVGLTSRMSGRLRMNKNFFLKLRIFFQVGSNLKDSLSLHSFFIQAPFVGL